MPANVKLLVLHKFWSAPALATGAGAVFVKIISSKVVGHVPLPTVQRNVALVPAATPVIVVVADVLLVITALPLCTVHTPLPTNGTVAFIVKVLVLHWSMRATPASAVLGVASLVRLTSSNVLPQTPLLIVQRTTVVAVTPVIVLVGEDGVVTVPVPLWIVHAPVPGAAALPANVKLLVLHKFWSGPAIAEGAVWSTVIVVLLVAVIPFPS